MPTVYNIHTDMGSEESARGQVGCGGNEDVKMDVWSYKDRRKRNARIKGAMKVGAMSKRVQEMRLK